MKPQFSSLKIRVFYSLCSHRGDRQFDDNLGFQDSVIAYTDFVEYLCLDCAAGLRYYLDM